jgi:DNA-binding MarR family transcriptional regulator
VQLSTLQPSTPQPSTLPPFADIVDLDNNCRQCQFDANNVAAGRQGAARKVDMTRTRSAGRRAVPYRSAAAERRGPHPAISLDALDNHLGYFVRRLQVWIFQDFIRALAPIDLSPAQFSVLVVINANRDLSQAEVGATLGIERARLARLLHGLERRRLVQRLPSDADGRRHALQLTRQGRTLLGRAKVLAARHQRRLIEKLGADRHDTLLEALRDS